MAAWSGLLWMVSLAACAADLPDAVAESDLPRHALEIQALTDPEGVLATLPAALSAATAAGNESEVALLNLAQANACRMVADWVCQRAAGARAQDHGETAQAPVLVIRGLIAEARAEISLQNYPRAEHLLGDAESRLKGLPSPELSADVALAYSTLSNTLGKYELGRIYADRGLSFLAAGKALPMRVRLLRNRARAQALLGELTNAAATLQQALDIAVTVVDPKLRAELHLEAARLARSGGDRAEVMRNANLALELSLQLKNSQIGGQAREVLGLAAMDKGDPVTAERELRNAMHAFRQLGLERDELNVVRELVAARLQFSRDTADWADLVQRMLELDSRVNSSERNQAADDFQARLQFEKQKLEMEVLRSDAALAHEREQALSQQNRLTGFLVLLSVAIVAVMAVFFVAQRRSSRQLRAALDARLRALTQTSHELRNPIGGVIGLSELLLHSQISPAQRSMVEAIHSAGATIAKLAQDLLDRGRIESGQLGLVYRPTSLRQLAESVHQLYLPRAGEKGLRLQLQLSPDLPEAVMLDAERLQQVLSNLIGNSLKFTERGEIVLSIAPRSAQADGRIRVGFAVRDTGPGIDPDEIGGLFEPFAKGRAGQRHRAGAGLGLAISADLVRLMGGQIGVTSEPQKGAEFHFELNLATCAVVLATADGVSERGGAGLSVLLVDDDEDVTLALRSQLELLGCAVDQAESSQSARSKVTAQHYDLLLLDVELPDGQGPELARALRAGEPNMQHTRVAIVSGHQAPKQLPASVDEWLTKPVLLDRLQMLVASAQHQLLSARAA